MRLSSLFSYCLLTAPSIVLALPRWLSPRQCSTAYASSTQIINKGFPDQSRPDDGTLAVWKDSNGTELNVLLQYTNIPANAWGCQLELFFPKDYPSLFPMYFEGNQLYVYRTNGVIQPNTSWNTAPSSAYLFGVTPAGLPQVQPVQNDIRYIVNSAQCAPMMSFRVSIPPDTPRGGVQYFRDNPSWKNVGFRITHNC